MRFALLLFILVPVIELSVLIQVGSQIGSLTTVALVFLTAIVGLALIRRQGLETSLKAQEKIQRGELPASEAAEGFMLALAGICLLIPGFVTDALGAVLLISPLRKRIASTLALDFLKKRMNMRASWSSYQQNNQRAKDEIIEGEYRNDKQDQDFIDKK